MAEKQVFTVPLTQVPPLPKQSIENAKQVLSSAQLFRFGENNADGQFVSAFEKAFAAYHGKKYAICVNSGGGALNLALRSAGLGSEDTVLLNAFTLAPVPGSIANIGCRIALVEITEDLVVNLQDLKNQIHEHRPKAFLISHMRGHFGNMDAVSQICMSHGVLLIEDCAHTLGAKWDGKLLGTFGVTGCFSLQTYKQINAGEGGVLLTDDDEIAARAILMSGSYELHQQHGCVPPRHVLEKNAPNTPNFSMRLNELAAAIALPQLHDLEKRNEAWRAMYERVEQELKGREELVFPLHDERVTLAPTSIQFLVKWPIDRIESFVDRCISRGVTLKWFGSPSPKGFTSAHHHWKYIPSHSLKATTSTLEKLCDLRLPSTLTTEDCSLLCSIIAEELDE